MPKLRAGINPATWMLEISTPAAEQRLNLDFAEAYRNSKLYRCVLHLHCVVHHSIICGLLLLFCAYNSVCTSCILSNTWMHGRKCGCVVG